MTKKKSCQKFISMILSIMLLLCTTINYGATAFAYDEPILDAPTAVAVDHRAGNMLYKKNDNKVVQIGALSNLMVALVALDKENIEGELRRNIIDMLDDNSDQAINAIVDATYSTHEKFIKAMNKKAQKLGCKNTEFKDTKGYSKIVTLAGEKNNKSSKYNTSTMGDIAKILKAFLYEEDLRKLVSFDEKEKEISYTVITEGDGKEKGNCGIIFGQKEKSQFAVISVGGASRKVSRAEGVELLEYVFDNYRTHQVFSKGKSTDKIKIKGGEKNYVKVYAKDDLYVTIPKEGEESLLKTRSVIEGDIVAPVKSGTVVGKMEVLEADEVTGTVPIIVREDVRKGGPLSKIGISDYMLKYMGIILGIVLIVFVILRIRIAKKKKRRREMIKRKRKAEAMRIARERQERRERGWPID